MDRKFVVTPQTGTPDVQGLMAADLSTSPFNLMAGSGFAEFRDRFVAMMESLSLAFLILDQELNFQYISEKALPFFGGIKVGDSFTKSIIVTERVIAAYKSVLDTGRDFVLRDYQPADSRFPKINMQAMRFGERLIVFYENVDAIEQKEQLARRSEERFQLLSESVNMALIIVNQALEVTYWNPRAEAMTGVSVASAVGLPAVQLFPSLSTAFIERCKTSLREHTAFSIDRYAYTGIRGSYIFSIRAFPVADELAILIDDHTTLAQSERQLATSEERFRTLAESISLALLLIDSDRKITYWNRACETTSDGILATAALHQDALGMLPFNEAHLDEILARAISGERDLRVRVEPEREGVHGTYDVRAFSVGDEVAVLVEDVTQQVMQAAELDRSNHNLLDLYNNAPCGYLSVLPDGTIAQINLRMALWLGYEQEHCKAEGLSCLLSASSFEYFQQELSNSGLESPLNNIELEFIKKNGEILRGLVNAIPIFDSVEKHWCWRWTVVDITELRAVQTQIEDSRLFTELFNELGEAVLISDKEGKLVRANRAASRILGMSIEELTELHHDSDVWKTYLEDGTPVATEDMPAVRALREKRSVTNLELGVLRPDGSLTWILESAAPLVNDQGEITGVIVTFPEVTSTVKHRQALKELNEKLAVERDRAHEANRLKSSFLANMSHEIRTPMTAILGFSDILSTELSGAVSEQHSAFLRSINISGKRLLTLLNDILDLSKIEAGRLDLQSEALDVMSEIDTVTSGLGFLAKQKGLSLLVEHRTERFAIRGDRQRIGQVLTNLLSNAIKFTRHGSITIAVDSPSLDEVSISVTDTGVGIDQDFLPHLFEEFRQEHTGVTREFGGTGLGLAITQRLVAMMSGSIQVKSEVGVGSTFILTFPRAHGTLDSEEQASRLFMPQTSSPSKSGLPEYDSVHKLKVLVVEDNVETQRLMNAYLREKYDVTQAHSAKEALESFHANIPDVILMDVNLGGKDGLSVTQEIRAGSTHPNVPIIALTAYAMTGDRERCIEAGCNDYLTKPATKREVLEIVERTYARVNHL
jgi:PAS domain S-box-containing protein